MTKRQLIKKRRVCKTGEKHHNWRGGRRIVNGYAMIAVKGHPRGSGNAGYVSEHILIVEGALGHALPPAAEVHHVDGVKGNNANGNLVACQDHAYHATPASPPASSGRMRQPKRETVCTLRGLR